VISFTKIQSGIKATTVALMLFSSGMYAQNVDLGHLQGNFQADAQIYREDTIIGAPDFPENLGSNSFVNLIYTRGGIEAGVRYEAYLPTMQGFTRESGSGIPYRYARYKGNRFDITAGTFYEQFGSGMILRSYEEWGLGWDNSIDGVRVKGEPIKGVYLKGLLGRQRNGQSNKVENLSDGIIRGIDAEWAINESFDSLSGSKTRITLGAGFVSRFQADNDPLLVIPENVGAYTGRFNISRGGFLFSAELSQKINDPSTVNDLIYKNGNGILVQTSYAKKGLGVSFQFKRIDNMDFRSDRSATGNSLALNFLPPQTRQHTYRLATLFPWATQPLGEWSMQGEVLYKIKKGTLLGGKYGTNLTFNMSRINALNKTTTVNPYDGYTAGFVGKMDSVLFQDINLEVSHKFSKKFKASVTLLHFTYDQSLFKQLTGFNSTTDVSADVQIVDMSFKVKPKHTVRVELQSCLTKQEFGSWAMALVEYTFAPHFFIAVFDEYNYGNAEEDKRLHYFSGTAGVNIDKYRFALGYGRQRAGVLCVGGVCRFVPASNGVTLSMTGTF
jgi:hypothetical protein